LLQQVPNVDDIDLFEHDLSGNGAAELTRQSLVDTQQRLGVMLDVLPIALLIHTEQGILFANQEACGLLQCEKAALTGQHLLDFVVADDHVTVSQTFGRAFASEGQTLTHECLISRPDSSQRLVNLILGRLPWPGNPVIQVLFQDVTDQKRAEASLRQLTITDELTGAYNRRHLFYEAELYIDQFASTRIPLSIVMIDIDHFKRINDTYGHTIGDLALVSITKLANGVLPTLRDSDSAIFARVGGEEFVMLLPGLAASRPSQVAESLRTKIAKLQVPTATGPIGFTASMGVATYCEADRTFTGLLARADAALYEAKRSGRNRVVEAN
jgi:diguanylate cyclase (GGDEF)-like protein/PAS domain S-box-containing protein